MARINIGYYLKPHVWIGANNREDATGLAVVVEGVSPGIDIAIQRQGLVLASINTDKIPSYRESEAANVIKSETASFVLNFFNAFSFAYYDAQLVKHQGGFQSVPQEIILDDLYLWLTSSTSLEDINLVQPGPICSGEFDTFKDGVNKLKKTVGHLDGEELKMRWEIEPSIFVEHFDKKLLSPNLIKLVALLNRGVVSIRGAAFDIALISFWAVIESTMKDLWSHFLIEKTLPKKRREFLTGRDITASIMSENLNLHGIIDEQLYSAVSEARKSRNKFMHELKPIDPGVCYRAFNTAKELIRIYHTVEITHKGAFYMGDINFGAR